MIFQPWGNGSWHFAPSLEEKSSALATTCVAVVMAAAVHTDWAMMAILLSDPPTQQAVEEQTALACSDICMQDAVMSTSSIVQKHKTISAHTVGTTSLQARTSQCQFVVVMSANSRS